MVERNEALESRVVACGRSTSTIETSSHFTYRITKYDSVRPMRCRRLLFTGIISNSCASDDTAIR